MNGKYFGYNKLNCKRTKGVDSIYDINDNMLKSTKDEIKEYVINHVCDEVVAALKAKGKGDSKESVADKIGDNVLEMQKTSQPVSGAAPRSVMPQTDAAPGSLDKLQKAVIDLES
jgi:hypothetical protein